MSYFYFSCTVKYLDRQYFPYFFIFHAFYQNNEFTENKIENKGWIFFVWTWEIFNIQTLTGGFRLAGIINSLQMPRLS